jgi:hypothetical protein
MGNGIHLSQKRKVRSRSQKAQEENITIVAARYVNDFSIALTFSSGATQLVNFLPLFDKYAKGDKLKYFAPERFKKFIVKNGNIYWGRNEDIIFPVNLLYKWPSTLTDDSEEILYVI